MPIPHQEDQHGRSLTSNVTPTPIKLKNELCQTQKYRLKLKNGQLTILGPSHCPSPHTTTAILHLPNYTASSQIKDTQPIVSIPSHPTIHADLPSGGSTRTEPDLQRHPYTNEAKELVMPNSKIPTQTQKWATDHFGAHFLGRCRTSTPHSSFLGPGELPIDYPDPSTYY